MQINEAVCAKLRTEISLQAYDLEVPMIWSTTTVRVYTGLVPLSQGLFHRIVVRQGKIAHVDPRDFSLKHLTDSCYYEVCVHSRIYEAIESGQAVAAAH